jgi:hypothetical protein
VSAATGYDRLMGCACREPAWQRAVCLALSLAAFRAAAIDQIRLQMDTDDRSRHRGTSITVGKLVALEGQPPQALTQNCSPFGRIGTLVVVPMATMTKTSPFGSSPGVRRRKVRGERLRAAASSHGRFTSSRTKRCISRLHERRLRGRECGVRNMLQGRLRSAKIDPKRH